MVLTNQGPGGDGQDSNDSRDFQAKMEGLLFRERQAIQEAARKRLEELESKKDAKNERE